MEKSEEDVVEEVLLAADIASAEHHPQSIRSALARRLCYFVMAVLKHETSYTSILRDLEMTYFSHSFQH